MYADIIEKLVINGITYLYLCSVDNEKDPEYLVQKIKVEGNNHFLVNLDSEEEFTKVISEMGRTEK